MAVCKRCGAEFQPTEAAPGCPRCAAAARTRKVAATGATQRPAAEPRAQGQPRPAAGARSAAPRPAAARATGEEPVRRPAARPKATATREPVERERHVVGEGRADDKLLDETTKYGLLGALALALIVGLIVLVVFRKKEAERKEREAYEASVVEVADKLKGLDANDAAKAADIIAFAEERRSLWEEHDLAGDIQARIVQAKATLEQEAQQRAALDRFTAVEEELKKPDLPVERMKDLRRQLEEMELRMLESGADLAARYAAARLGADKAYAQRLLDEARAFRDANQGNPRLVLAQYQPAEDEIKVLLDRSYFDKNKELQDYYTPLYQQSIEEADAVAVALSKAGGDVAWIDCLAPPQASNWNASAVSGFSHQVQNGALKLIGPDADAGKLAVISIGDREQWRHFELDIEFVIEKGDFELYLRLGRSPNSNTLSVPLRTATEPKNLVTGKKYAARISVIGSRWSVRYEGEDIDTPSPQEGDIHWASGRKGGIGFVVMPESRATFTRFRVRELR